MKLVKEAMKSNITKEDFKQFLKEEKEKRDKGLR
ncbi:DNA-binding anti-repressor SinI [Bacillus sp. ISL-40]|nr:MULTISPECIES: DNA-binding anti-repressor SinI [unclassified Bacillus (in: firmicutes)]MBT2696498.1 DNA-binding anti-repressor SinI [Bacillus sp. ISL-40]MBT2722252.1 DNA-binding anti-repressor SinI [Bacillus sp. ISL-46]MBT2728249.1 DNA-binding anti-repressor SinI [Bacillus sp. ISL-75]MBT2743748.1 DNA-binding anti-repressor SinI [Bacillus sp. ISL-77]